MHPDNVQLAAYIDGALGADERAALRGHILTCPACAARIERLHADAHRIAAASSSARPAPDVRAALRARMRRGSAGPWIARAGALAGALAALLLFALLIGSGGGTIGRVQDKLFVTDALNGRLVVLDAYSGARLDSAAVGGNPTALRYDRRLGRIYVLTNKGVVAVDQRTLAIVNRWAAPESPGTGADLALDQARGRLYVSQPGSETITPLDTNTLAPAPALHIGGAPGALALAPDGQTLFALDSAAETVWKIDLKDGARATRLFEGNQNQLSWFALSDDGRTAYLLGVAPANNAARADAALWRIDTRSGDAQGPFALDRRPQPWDLLLLDAQHLAVARGDGLRGGVEIVATDSMSLTSRLDPAYDEHHLARGPGATLFALNWLHGSVTRYNLSASAPAWRTESEGWQPWEGVFVQGGWRWPW